MTLAMSTPTPPATRSSDSTTRMPVLNPLAELLNPKPETLNQGNSPEISATAPPPAAIWLFVLSLLKSMRIPSEAEAGVGAPPG